MHKPRVDFLLLAVKTLWGDHVDELRPCRRAASPCNHVCLFLSQA